MLLKNLVKQMYQWESIGVGVEEVNKRAEILKRNYESIVSISDGTTFMKLLKAYKVKFVKLI
jgi:hypothetical protein